MKKLTRFELVASILLRLQVVKASYALISDYYDIKRSLSVALLSRLVYSMTLAELSISFVTARLGVLRMSDNALVSFSSPTILVLVR